MVKNEYETPLRTAEFEYSEKKSVFIASLAPVGTEDEAKSFIDAVKKKNADARHNVWAYALPDGTVRSCDDGEPAGTGGAPVLDSIVRRGLTGCVIVVTRYFGGILLGTGGLVRAYSTAASGAIERAGRAVVRTFAEVSVVCSYARYGAVSRIAGKYSARPLDADFGGEVCAKYLLPEERFDAFARDLTDAFSGQLIPQKLRSVAVKSALDPIDG